MAFVDKFFNKNPSTDELYMFFLQFSQFYSTGGSLVTALDFLMDQVENLKLKEAVKAVRRAVSNGKPVSEAMSGNTIFPPFCGQLIYAGEVSGSLDETMGEIGRDLNQTGDIERKISGALLPVKIVSVIIGVAFAVAVFWVLPMFRDLYVDLKIELPLITRFVLGMGDFCVSFWYLLLALGIGFVYFLHWYKKKHPEVIDSLKFKIPLYQSIYYYRIQYRFAKVFGLLCQAGIVPVDGLGIVARSMDNVLVTQVLKDASKDVLRGVDVSVALKMHNQKKLIDKVTINFIATSESSTGRLDEILLKAADYYDNILMYKIQKFSEKIGPLFLTPMMFMILFLLLSVYYPMFMINSSIK